MEHFIFCIFLKFRLNLLVKVTIVVPISTIYEKGEGVNRFRSTKYDKKIVSNRDLTAKPS